MRTAAQTRTHDIADSTRVSSAYRLIPGGGELRAHELDDVEVRLQVHVLDISLRTVGVSVHLATVSDSGDLTRLIAVYSVVNEIKSAFSSVS